MPNWGGKSNPEWEVDLGLPFRLTHWLRHFFPSDKHHLKSGFYLTNSSVGDPQGCWKWADYKWEPQSPTVLPCSLESTGLTFSGWMSLVASSPRASQNRSFSNWGASLQSDWQLELLLKTCLLSGKGFKLTLTPTWTVLRFSRKISSSRQPQVPFRFSLIESCLRLLQSLTATPPAELDREFSQPT